MNDERGRALARHAIEDMAARLETAATFKVESGMKLNEDEAIGFRRFRPTKTYTLWVEVESE